MKEGTYHEGAAIFCIRAKDSRNTPPKAAGTDGKGKNFTISDAPVYLTGRHGDNCFRYLDLNLCRCGYAGSKCNQYIGTSRPLCKTSTHDYVYETSILSEPFNSTWSGECATNESISALVDGMDFNVYFKFKEEDWQESTELASDKWQFFYYARLAATKKLGTDKSSAQQGQGKRWTAMA